MGPPDAERGPGQGPDSQSVTTTHQRPQSVPQGGRASRLITDPEPDQVKTRAARYRVQDPGQLEVAGQVDLLTGRTVREPIPARITDVETSWKAGKKARTSEVRARIEADMVRHLQVHGALSDHELQQLLADDHPGTVSKVRLALVRSGEVVDAGFTRTTRWGREAQVWKLADR